MCVYSIKDPKAIKVPLVLNESAYRPLSKEVPIGTYQKKCLTAHILTKKIVRSIIKEELALDKQEC